MRVLFAVLPYIKTTERFRIGGMTFRSSRDVEGLMPEEVEHLRHIADLFYLSDDKPLNEVVYTLLRLPEDHDEIDAQIRQLRSAHTILTFLVTQEHLYDTYEGLTIYAITPTQVFSPPEVVPVSLLPGYSITVNWLHWCEIAQGKKLYPPEPYPFALIPKGGDLSDLLHGMRSRALLYGDFEEFVRGRLLDQPEQAERFQTILRAMAWYNRSFSHFDSHEEKIVHLAVAFETLFHEPKSDTSIREEVNDHRQRRWLGIMHLEGALLPSCDA